MISPAVSISPLTVFNFSFGGPLPCRAENFIAAARILAAVCDFTPSAAITAEGFNLFWHSSRCFGEKTNSFVCSSTHAWRLPCVTLELGNVELLPLVVIKTSPKWWLTCYKVEMAVSLFVGFMRLRTNNLKQGLYRQCNHPLSDFMPSFTPQTETVLSIWLYIASRQNILINVYTLGRSNMFNTGFFTACSCFETFRLVFVRGFKVIYSFVLCSVVFWDRRS